MPDSIPQIDPIQEQEMDSQALTYARYIVAHAGLRTKAVIARYGMALENGDQPCADLVRGFCGALFDCALSGMAEYTADLARFRLMNEFESRIARNVYRLMKAVQPCSP